MKNTLLTRRIAYGFVSVATAASMVVPTVTLANDGGHGFWSWFGGKANIETKVKAESKTQVQVDATCVKPAVATREAAIAAAWSTYASAMSTAYANRSAALAVAWSNSDASVRAQAELTAWTNFRDAAKTARNNLATAKKNAWTAFKNTAKSCKVTPNSSTSADVSANLRVGESIDND
jgi:hypothetical protein